MKTSQTSDGCSTFTQRAAFPGDARNTAGIKAIPHSTFSKELIQIFYFVFHQFVAQNSLCKRVFTKYCTHFGGWGGGELNRLLVRNSNQELFKMTPAFWPNRKINLAGLN